MDVKAMFPWQGGLRKSKTAWEDDHLCPVDELGKALFPEGWETSEAEILSRAWFDLVWVNRFLTSGHRRSLSSHRIGVLQTVWRPGRCSPSNRPFLPSTWLGIGITTSQTRWVVAFVAGGPGPWVSVVGMDYEADPLESTSSLCGDLGFLCVFLVQSSF